MDSIVKTINDINLRIGHFASWFTGLLVLVVIYDIFMRYVFKLSNPWIMELEWHMFSIIFLLGAAHTFQADRHVRVDLFYSKFSPQEKARINILGNLLFLLPWCIFIIRYAFSYAYSAYLVGEGSPDPGGLPYRFIIKFCIVLGFFFLALQAISNTISSIRILQESKIKKG